MPETNRCPRCGTELPVETPPSMCPKCLLQAGLESQSGASGPAAVSPAADLPPTSSSPAGSHSHFVPLAVAELAPMFPQLEILELIGKGGMGAVYKARQPRLDRFVAVKVLPREIAATPGFAERFAREAQSLARLSHPNIVAVYDFGETDNLFYFVMEFVDGVNIRHAIQTQELTPNQALAIVPQICEALQFAHDEGIVHRDIKPENILLDKKGRVKIADFGLAKLLGANQPEHNLTGTQQVMGTLRYMAPEQIEATRTVDHRADIYSLGVVFYEMLTGELPLGRFAPPSKKVQIDVRLDEVVLRALEKEPDRRYQQASELKTGVEQLRQTPAPVAAPPGTPLSNIPRLSRCALWGAIWAPCVFLLGFVFLYFLMYRTDWMSPLGFCVVIAIVLGATAPFGTTILGTVAIGHVKRSKGQLYGLPLAFFDALVFPLLLLDGIIMVVVAAITMLVLVTILNPFGGSKSWPGQLMEILPEALTLAISLPIIAWVDYRIVRAVWRRVTGDEVPPRADGQANLAAVDAAPPRQLDEVRKVVLQPSGEAMTKHVAGLARFFEGSRVVWLYFAASLLSIIAICIALQQQAWFDGGITDLAGTDFVLWTVLTTALLWIVVHTAWSAVEPVSNLRKVAHLAGGAFLLLSALPTIEKLPLVWSRIEYRKSSSSAPRDVVVRVPQDVDAKGPDQTYEAITARLMWRSDGMARLETDKPIPSKNFSQWQLTTHVDPNLTLFLTPNSPSHQERTGNYSTQCSVVLSRPDGDNRPYFQPTQAEERASDQWSIVLLVCSVLALHRTWEPLRRMLGLGDPPPASTPRSAGS